MRLLQNYKSAFTGLSKESWLLSAVLMINRCGFMAVPFIGLYVTQNLHRPKEDAGLIITLFGVGSVFGSAAGGKLTDMLGFRKVQIGAAVSGGLLFFVFGSITHFETLCVMAVILSFFTDAFGPANFAAIAAYAAKGTLTRAYSLNRLAVNIGWTLGVSMGGMIAAYNYHLLFVIEGVISILAGLLIYFLLPPSAGNVLREKKNPEMAAPPLKPWKDRSFMQFILVCAVMVICFFQMFRVVPIFLKEKWQMNEFVIGEIMAINGLLIALVEMVLIARLENRHSPIFYVVIGAVLLSLSYYLLALPGWLPVLLSAVVMVLFTFGEMLTTPFINTLVISRSNAANRGLYAASYNMCWSLAQIVGPSTGLYVADHWGYRPLWLALGSLLAACSFLFFRMEKKMEHLPVAES